MASTGRKSSITVVLEATGRGIDIRLEERDKEIISLKREQEALKKDVIDMKESLAGSHGIITFSQDSLSEKAGITTDELNEIIRNQINRMFRGENDRDAFPEYLENLNREREKGV